jgi:hypothetical protein
MFLLITNTEEVEGFCFLTKLIKEYTQPLRTFVRLPEMAKSLNQDIAILTFSL